MRIEQRGDGTYVKMPSPTELKLGEAVGLEVRERKGDVRRIDESVKRTQTDLANVRNRMTTLEMKWTSTAENAGIMNIYRDANGQIVKMLGPDFSSYMWYYEDGSARLDYGITLLSTHAVKERFIYDLEKNHVNTDRTIHNLNDPIILDAINSR